MRYMFYTHRHVAGGQEAEQLRSQRFYKKLPVSETDQLFFCVVVALLRHFSQSWRGIPQSWFNGKPGQVDLEVAVNYLIEEHAFS